MSTETSFLTHSEYCLSSSKLLFNVIQRDPCKKIATKGFIYKTAETVIQILILKTITDFSWNIHTGIEKNVYSTIVQI